MNTRLSLLSAALLAAGLAPFNAQALSLPVIADTSAPAASPAGNLVTVTVSPTVKGLLKFDLSALPTGVQSTDIAKATLVVFVKGVTTGGKLQASTAGSAWAETATTAPTINSPAAGSSASTISQINTYTTLDVTTAVQDWISGTNNGLVIEPDLSTPTASLTFDSKEATSTSHAAYIEVTLAAPAASISGTTTTTLTGILKGDGANISAAAAGTDYLTPTGDGSGLTNLDAGNISTGTLSAARLPISGVAQGTYTNANITVDNKGRIIAASIGAAGGTVTSITAGTGLSGGTITTAGTISLPNVGTANTYASPSSITTDAQGRVTSVTAGSGGGNATSIQGTAVSSTPPTNGQALIYNNTTSRWEPKSTVYDSSGNAVSNAKIVTGTLTAIPLNVGGVHGSKSVTFTGNAAMSTPICTATVVFPAGSASTTPRIATAANTLTVYNGNTSSTMDVNYICIGS